jgi:hypothetical protein
MKIAASKFRDNLPQHSGTQRSLTWRSPERTYKRSNEKESYDNRNVLLSARTFAATNTDALVNSVARPLPWSVAGPSDGANPIGSPLLHAGAIYSSTQNGGSGPCHNGFAQGCGIIFKLTASGETVLHDFSAGADGAYPRMLILGRDGNLYGVTGYGGAFGSVIRVDPATRRGHGPVLVCWRLGWQ